jgi:hypothetical protein
VRRPKAGRHLDDGELTELERLVEDTGELVDQAEQDLASDPR